MVIDNDIRFQFSHMFIMIRLRINNDQPSVLFKVNLPERNQRDSQKPEHRKVIGPIDGIAIALAIASGSALITIKTRSLRENCS
jgi:hypothetical protein